MKVFRIEQYVCTVCGYNIIENLPDNCPFCGTSKEHFISARFCSKNYKIIENKITDRVFSLKTLPKLGFDHLSYCIRTDNQRIWIDCPSTFQDNLDRMDKILLTHNHFLGASNLYRSYYTAFIWIQQLDADNFLSQNYAFDKKFSENFKLNGIEAFHINGHTQGFTIYIFQDILFISDYIILTNDGMQLNPYGPNKETIHGAFKIKQIIENKDITKICGYNYVIDYLYWEKKFEDLLNRIAF